MTTYHAYDKTWKLEERDQVIVKGQNNKPVALGYNHSRPWRESFAYASSR